MYAGSLQPVIAAVRAKCATAWPEIVRLPEVAVAQQVAMLAGSGKFPQGAIQSGEATFGDAGAKGYDILQTIHLHYLALTQPGSDPAAYAARDRCMDMMMALLNDYTLSGLAEDVHPVRVLAGDSNPVNMEMAATGNNLGCAAATAVFVVRWSINGAEG